MSPVQRHGKIWAELERDVHRVLREMLKNREAIADPERIAQRVLLARSDISATMRDELVDALAETVRRQAELLGKKN
jgi:hypothetical protein